MSKLHARVKDGKAACGSGRGISMAEPKFAKTKKQVTCKACKRSTRFKAGK